MRNLIDNIVLMKYGAHAGETSDSIIERKNTEMKKSGKVFWGYGGTLCHPLNQIQPFLEENRRKNQKTFLVLAKTKTKTKNEILPNVNRARFYSENKVDWEPIPSDNIVTGSRYAVICRSFEKCNINIDLSLYRIPFGNAKGCRLSDYLGWRRNKACGRYSEEEIDISIPLVINISIIAEIENAVFVQ